MLQVYVLRVVCVLKDEYEDDDEEENLMILSYSSSYSSSSATVFKIELSAF